MSTNILESKELRPLVNFAMEDRLLTCEDGENALETAIASLEDTTRELKRCLEDYRNAEGNHAQKLFRRSKCITGAAKTLRNQDYNDVREYLYTVAGQLDILAKMHVRLEYIAESESK